MAAAGATIPLAECQIAKGASASGDFIVASFVRPVLFQVGPISVKSFGLFVGLSTIVSFFCIGEDFKRARIKLSDLEETWGVVIIVICVGLFAKFYFVFSEWTNGSLDVNDVFLGNGYAFQGAVGGGFVALSACAYVRKLSIWTVMDIVMPNVLAAHILGKVGCFLSGDGCYGPPADPKSVPWAMSFPNGMDPTRVPVHPTPIYEGVSSLIVYMLTCYYVPWPQKKRYHGRRTAFCLSFASCIRVFIEKYRRHASTSLFFGLTEYQVNAIIFLLVALIIEFGVVRRRGETPEDPDEFLMAELAEKEKKKDSDEEGSDDSDEDEGEETKKTEQATAMPKAKGKPQAQKTAVGKKK